MNTNKTITLITTLFLLWSAASVEAQRARTLEAIIHTPFKSTATAICRSKGGNLLLQVQFSIFHCYFDTTKVKKR